MGYWYPNSSFQEEAQEEYDEGLVPKGRRLFLSICFAVLASRAVKHEP